MSVPDILRKVRRVQIVANRRVDDLFAGRYHSVFRGSGMEFDEVREYQPGDDVRSIDWNVTARAGAPFIKRFREERELTVVFLLDVSASGAFGSRDRSKLELAVEIAAVLMFSALKNNDKVGLVLFAHGAVRYYPPRKGKSQVLRLIREAVALEPAPGETDLDAALEFLYRVQKRRAVVFLISDFLAPRPPARLASANKRYDLVAIHITDPREETLPNAGIVLLEDAETGAVVEIDTADPATRSEFERSAAKRREELSALVQKSGIDLLRISPVDDYLTSFHRFFAMRERRFR